MSRRFSVTLETTYRWQFKSSLLSSGSRASVPAGESPPGTQLIGALSWQPCGAPLDCSWTVIGGRGQRSNLHSNRSNDRSCSQSEV
eukprot:scaffold1583_cov299-Pinguiococcus_pyrenoidosus.AAC.30